MNSMTFGEARRRLEALGCKDVKLVPFDMHTDNPSIAITYKDGDGITHGLKARGGNEVKRLFDGLFVDRLHRVGAPLVEEGCKARGLECRPHGRCEYGEPGRWDICGLHVMNLFDLPDPTLETLPQYVEQRLNEIAKAQHG